MHIPQKLRICISEEIVIIYCNGSGPQKARPYWGILRAFLPRMQDCKFCMSSRRGESSHLYINLNLEYEYEMFSQSKFWIQILGGTCLRSSPVKVLPRTTEKKIAIFRLADPEGTNFVHIHWLYQFLQFIDSFCLLLIFPQVFWILS